MMRYKPGNFYEITEYVTKKPEEFDKKGFKLVLESSTASSHQIYNQTPNKPFRSYTEHIFLYMILNRKHNRFIKLNIKRKIIRLITIENLFHFFFYTNRWFTVRNYSLKDYFGRLTFHVAACEMLDVI